MRNLLIMAVLAVGSYQLYLHYQEYATAAYDENGNPLTLLFTASGCPPCDNARELLKKRRVDFEEFNVSEESEQLEKMKDFGGGRAFPYMVTGNRKVSGFDKQAIIGALAEIHGERVLTRQERKILASHFDAAGNPLVVMYATERCGYCIKAREYFDDKGIEFTEFDIDRSAVAKRNFNALGAPGTPLIYVGYRRTDGFNKKKLDEALASL